MYTKRHDRSGDAEAIEAFMVLASLEGPWGFVCATRLPLEFEVIIFCAKLTYKKNSFFLKQSFSFVVG